MSVLPAAAASGAPPATIVNIAAYRFVRLQDLGEWRSRFRAVTAELQLKGTVLLSREGINLFVAGERQAVSGFLLWLRSHPEFAGIEAKESPGGYQPFNRMLVRLKKEIISMGVPDIDPVDDPAPRISPQTLRQWLDEGRPLTLLDTRNDYEVELGTFVNARAIGISHFRQFPEAVRRLPESLREQPIVMFCTGGIRCEKAGPLMLREGFRQVHQLEGGILKYFEECGGRHFQGDCFVFDKRVAVNPGLEETATTVCFACQAVLTVEQQSDPRYRPPDSCPACFRSIDQQVRERIARRQESLDVSLAVLPGAAPYTNIRPLNVPGDCGQRTALELFCRLHGHLGIDYWRSEFAAGNLRYRGLPLQPETPVLGGWRIEHLLPGTVEPAVNSRIRILHEDDQIVVVDKPAPLPMHPSGRFNRNTLVAMLNGVYPNELLRPAHRLDANTSGVVVFSRNRAVARRLQPQFEAGTVGKIYLARIHGVPGEKEFGCDAAIAREAGPSGGRSLDPDGLAASTAFCRVADFGGGQSLVECRPLTGRTNQIRLHLAALGMPVVGDPVYGVGNSIRLDEAGDPASVQCGDPDLPATLAVGDPPMCLHAWRLEFVHPEGGERVVFEAPLPEWAQTPG